MTRIVFKDKGTENGYVQGKMPEMPKGSVLRGRFEEPQKECEYTGSEDNETARHGPWTKLVKKRKDTNDRCGLNVRSPQNTALNEFSSGPRSFSECLKGVPLWAISAVLCTIGALTLLTPCLSVMLRYDGIVMFSHDFCLLDLFDPRNQNVFAGYTKASPWMVIVPAVASLCMTVFFLLKRECSYEKAYVPALVGLTSVIRTVKFILDIGLAISGKIMIVQIGAGVFLMLFVNIMLIMFSIIKGISASLKKRCSC